MTLFAPRSKRHSRRLLRLFLKKAPQAMALLEQEVLRHRTEQMREVVRMGRELGAAAPSAR